MNKPAIVKDKYLVYLDDLRKSGETNIFALGGYLQKKFGVKVSDALEILLYWKETFDTRQALRFSEFNRTQLDKLF